MKLGADRPDERRDTGVLFADMSRSRQVWESAGGALAVGTLCGLLLSVTWWAYLIGVLVSTVGGLPAGGQHRTLAGALTRGAAGGVCWCIAVLLAQHATGRAPAVPFPDPAAWFLGWALLPTATTAVAWFITRRRASAAPPAPRPR